jgi:hypothetical protein
LTLVSIFEKKKKKTNLSHFTYGKTQNSNI